jgi:hypothetical protein
MRVKPLTTRIPRVTTRIPSVVVRIQGFITLISRAIASIPDVTARVQPVIGCNPAPTGQIQAVVARKFRAETGNCSLADRLKCRFIR